MLVDTECNGNRIEIFECSNGWFIIAVNEKIVNRYSTPLEVIRWMANAMMNLKSPVTNEAKAKHIISIILSGKKIEAIKEHRNVTGFGLKESKDAVERVQATLYNDPQWFNANMGQW